MNIFINSKTGVVDSCCKNHEKLKSESMVKLEYLAELVMDIFKKELIIALINKTIISDFLAELDYCFEDIGDGLFYLVAKMKIRQINGEEDTLVTKIPFHNDFIKVDEETKKHLEELCLKDAAEFKSFKSRYIPRIHPETGKLQ